MSMETKAKHESLKEVVVRLKEAAEPNGLLIKEIISIFGSRSHAFVILFFNLPFLQPVPTMGLSAAFGFVIMLMGFYWARNKPPWLPKRITDKRISQKLIDSCCEVMVKILNKSEKLIKPRFNFWLNNPAFKWFNGFLIILFAFLLSLPLPIPFSNSVPAYFLVLNALALLEEDGVLMLVSFLVALGGLIFFASLGFGAVEMIDYIRLKLGV